MKRIVKAALMMTTSIMLIVILFFASILGYGLMTYANDGVLKMNMQDISQALVKEGGAYTFREPSLLDGSAWAMLINNDGQVVWNHHLPAEVPRHYTVTDIASFTRWYLADYPVTTLIRDDGLLVTAKAKHSLWKYTLIFSMESLTLVPWWMLGSFFCMLAAVLGSATLLLRQWFKQDKSQEDAARAAWVEGVSHDIRTPLSLVMLDAASIEKSPCAPDTQKMASRIVTQSHYIRDLIGDLNLTMQLSGGSYPLRLETIQPEALVRDAAATLFNSGMADDYPLSLHLPNAPLPSIYGDKVLLKRALMNLLINGVRHNPPSTAITITICAKDALIITLETHSPAGALPQGTGMRLVDTILRAHKGSAHWQTGESTLCTLTLPLE